MLIDEDLPEMVSTKKEAVDFLRSKGFEVVDVPHLRKIEIRFSGEMVALLENHVEGEWDIVCFTKKSYDLINQTLGQDALRFFVWDYFDRPAETGIRN